VLNALSPEAKEASREIVQRVRPCWKRLG
jgi:hypothetical protein